MTLRGFRSAVVLFLVFLQIASCSAQTPGTQPQLSPAAAQVRTNVQDLPIGGKLTVTMLNGSEYYGNLRSIEGDSFSIREVDLKRVLTLRYEDVKRVRKDYGRPGFGGRRVHPRTNRIAAIVILAALLGLVIGAVAADKS
jgi:hypothetical protein